MNRQNIYNIFWSEFVARTSQHSELMNVHGELRVTANHDVHYLDKICNGVRYRYNIYKKYDFAVVRIEKGGWYESKVSHGFGTLRSMDIGHWEEVQELMIEAMLALSHKHGDL